MHIKNREREEGDIRITPPTQQEKEAIQDKCRKYVKEMTHCRHCRADTIGQLGKEIPHRFSV